MTESLAEAMTSSLEFVEGPMIELRHDLHAHPELAFEEHRTTGVIRDRLTELGWELRACPTATGAVARLTTGRPGKRVLVRADIDALPVSEEVSISYASRIDGVMHACGHDVHTAALLGVADLLARRREDLAGEFTLFFQPAEEAIGGARAMIEGGVLRDNPVDVAVGAHVTSLLPVGMIASRPGTIMSAGQMISVHVTGKGGHGAMATVAGNVVLAISALAPRLGEVVEGLAYEGTNCACSAGVLTAGTANNVVPRHALLRGTLRTFTSDQRTTAVAALRSLLEEIDDTFEVHSELRLEIGTPAVVNDPHVTKAVMASARRLRGEPAVLTIPPMTPSDDVSEFFEHVPGCYLFIGGAFADGSSGMHHGPDFSIDDAALRVQAGVLATAAADLAAS